LKLFDFFEAPNYWAAIIAAYYALSPALLPVTLPSVIFGCLFVFM
jgi:hypothetical protein